VRGRHLSVDGKQVLAKASNKNRVSREAFSEAAEVNRTVCEYLEELAAQNPTPETPATALMLSARLRFPVGLCRLNGLFGDSLRRQGCSVAQHLRFTLSICW